MPPTSLPVFDRRSVDNSVLTSMGRCPRLAYYNYKLCRAGRAINYPIQFGVAYHIFRDVLEKIYIDVCLRQEKELTVELQKKFFELAVARALEDFEDPPTEHRKSYLDTSRVIETCEAAFDTWLDEKQQGFYKVIGTETPFELPLPSGRPFSGKIDQTLEWNGRLWIRDWKTTSYKENRSDYWTSKYNPNHQITGYVWAAQELSGRKVSGAIIENVYNIKTKGPLFFNTLASRTSGDIQHWLEWVEDQYDEWERRSETGTWPMRTSSCGDYGGCFFKEACNSGDWNTIERFLEMHTVESHWDPLEPDKEVGLPE